MAATTEHAQELAHARRLLVDERHSDAVHTLERFLRDGPSPRERVEALTLRLTGLLRLGRTAELNRALEEAFDASQDAPDLACLGELNALAAIVTYQAGSLDRCTTHLVRSARALGAIELTDATTAWAWHDLALAYSSTGFHGHALAAIDHARQVAESVGLRTADFAFPVIRLRLAVALDHTGDTDGCQRVLRDVLIDLEHRRQAGDLDLLRPSSRGAYGYAIARLGAFGEADPVTVEEARTLLDAAGDSRRAHNLRALGAVCLAIAQRRPVEAVARLEAVAVTDETLGPAEVHRLRALAHLAAGDHSSAYRADRHAFRVASTQFERLRELFLEAVAARLDSEALRRSVAGYADGQHTDPLTGLPTREHLDRHISQLLARDEPVLVGLVDLDGFGQLNTTHGRPSGDLVLQRVAGVLNRTMRQGDFVARAGGDAFAVVLPASARAEAREIGRRILMAVAAEDWDGLVPGTRVTVTVGWAGVTEADRFGTPAEALDAAARAVTQARRPR